MVSNTFMPFFPLEALSHRRTRGFMGLGVCWRVCWLHTDHLLMKSHARLPCCLLQRTKQQRHRSATYPLHNALEGPQQPACLLSPSCMSPLSVLHVSSHRLSQTT
ncbi:uncharacterized [Tachysurus ichikawai]